MKFIQALRIGFVGSDKLSSGQKAVDSSIH